MKEALGERTHLEHIPQAQAGLKCHSSHFSLPASLMLRLVAQTLEQNIALGQFLRASGSWFLFICAAAASPATLLNTLQPQGEAGRGCSRRGDINWGHSLEQADGKIGETKGKKL